MDSKMQTKITEVKNSLATSSRDGVRDQIYALARNHHKGAKYSKQFHGWCWTSGNEGQQSLTGRK